MATLISALSLFFNSGLSSPGLLGCLAMCFRYADLLYLWLCTHSLLDQGVRGLFACPSPSSLLWFCMFRWALFSLMVHTLRDGATPAGSRLVCPRSERRFSVVSLSLWAVSSCCPCPSGYSHHMGQVCWFGAPDGSRGCCALSPYGWASNLCLRLLFAPCPYRCVSSWSSLRQRVFGCP